MGTGRGWRKAMKNKDTVSSFILILVALLVCYSAKKISLWGPDGPGEGLFPFLGGLALMAFGSILFLQSYFKPQKSEKMGEGIRKIKLLLYIGSLFAYFLLFEWMGFILTTFFFILIICKGAEKAPWKDSIIVSSLSTVLFYLIFYYFLDVPFPFGFLKALVPAG